MGIERSTTVTTGLFPLLSQPAAAMPGLTVWVSNTTPRSAFARVVVSSADAGRRIPQLDTRLKVPAAGTASIDIPELRGFEGRSAEVTVTMSSPSLEPSAAIMDTFESDETQEVLLYIPSCDFARVW